MKTNSLLRQTDYPEPSGGDPKAPLQQEPGSVENRLSLDPSAFPVTQDWQDGETYTLKLKVSQISPGEFEVMEATEDESAAEDKTETAEEPAGDMPMMKGKSKNPAVASLME